MQNPMRLSMAGLSSRVRNWSRGEPHSLTANSSGHTTFLATRRFATLDILRAIAIVGVVWHHATPNLLTSPDDQKSYNVLIFFVVSGFAVGTMLTRSRAAGTLSIRDFYARRAFRLLPLYYAVLALYTMLAACGEADPAVRSTFFCNLPYFATFTNNAFVDWHGDRVIFLFVWSLAYEQQFYLVWPWIERSCRPAVAFAIAMGMTLTALAIMLVARNAYLIGELLVVIVSIGSGLLLAQLLHRERLFQVIAPVLDRRGAAATALAAVVLCRVLDDWLGAFALPAIIASVTLLVASCVVSEHNDLSRLLRWRWIVALGTLSYGIFMFHMLAVNVIKRLEGVVHVHYEIVDFAGGLALAVLIARISYSWFEKPIIDWGQRLVATRRRRAPVRMVTMPSTGVAA